MPCLRMSDERSVFRANCACTTIAGPTIFHSSTLPGSITTTPIVQSCRNQFCASQANQIAIDLNTMPPTSPTSKSTRAPAQTPSPEPKPTRQRPPPPTLFQAPPALSLPPLSRSPNASHTSLLLPSANPTTTNAKANPTPATKPSSHRPTPSNTNTNPNAADANPDADALWRAMQHTLSEVELTAAAARNAHVFGAQHAAALAQLRGAQIGLAQAWGRGSGGEGEGMDSVVEGTETGVDARDATEGGKKDERSADGGGKGTGTGTGTGTGEREKGRARSGSVLAEETRSDLLLARKRREANDRYFARVKESVGDVVERLEAVAGAMRAVERESRDVWSSGGESGGGTSASAGGSARASAGGN